MNVNMNTSSAMASVAGQQNSGESGGISLLQKTAKIEAQNAQVLIDSIPKAEKTSVNLPDNLGKNVNTTA